MLFDQMPDFGFEDRVGIACVDLINIDREMNVLFILRLIGISGERSRSGGSLSCCFDSFYMK